MALRSLHFAIKAFLSTGVAGAIAHWIWGEPYLTIMAAALGGTAGVLTLATDDDIAPASPSRHPNDPVDDSTQIAPQLVHALPFGALIVQDNGTIQTINTQARDLFGVGDVSGLPVATLRTRRLLDLIEQVQSGEPGGHTDLTLARQTDTHLVAHVSRITKGSAPAANSPAILVLFEDQTRAQKAGALHRDFVANASHELKTPLAAISASVETLQGHARGDPEATQRFLDLLMSQSTRMTRLVNDLLSLNRIELNERVEPDAPQDLFAVIREVVDILNPVAAEAGVELKLQSPDAPPMVLADRDELAQLFQNLIENAIKYGAAGKQVTITATPPSNAHPRLFGITVQDHGPGIDAAHIPRLTERFYRVSVASSREKGGTGLGLAIVKHIVNRHRGRLEIQSNPGQGASFTVWLRRAEDTPDN